MARRKGDLSLDLGALPELPMHVSHVPEPDAPLTLSMDEMKEIEAQAKAEVDAELKKQLRADYLAKTKADLKKKTMFARGQNDKGEKLEEIFIDLPKFSDRITLDQVVYMHGYKYSFSPAKAAVIKEIMWRQWYHQAEISGLDTNEFMGRKAQNASISPKHMSA